MTLQSIGKSKKSAWEDPDYHAFFVPKGGRWKNISSTFENVGEKIDKDELCTAVWTLDGFIMTSRQKWEASLQK